DSPAGPTTGAAAQLPPPHVRSSQQRRCSKVGLFSNRREEQLAFWQHTVGLPFDHIGKLGRGMQQHRRHMNGSILKMNHARDRLPGAPASAILELRIARSGLSTAQSLADPDGNHVMRVPTGAEGIVGIGVVLKVSDLAVSDHFYVNVMGCLREGEGVWRCGDTLLIARERGPVANIGGLRAPGFRYLASKSGIAPPNMPVSWLASPTSHLRLLIDVWSSSA